MNDWDSKHVLFVVRHRDDLLYEPIRELDLPQHAAQNVLIDEIIELKGAKTSLKYPKRLRRIAIWNEEHEFTLQLLTNNMQLAASTVAALYKSRWQIEIFFRNLKQLLRSHPLNRSLISDIQQISLRISLLNLQVFLSS
ncbi:transposase [Porphyromonas gulae]|uniref:transposase n=1 Tax=Porphyromonas gulae TaxID=111105 RepID=UPI0006907BB6